MRVMSFFVLQNGYKLGGSPAESPFGMSAEAARLWQGTVTATTTAPSERPDASNVSLEDVMMVSKCSFAFTCEILKKINKDCNVI